MAGIRSKTSDFAQLPECIFFLNSVRLFFLNRFKRKERGFSVAIEAKIMKQHKWDRETEFSKFHFRITFMIFIAL